MIKIENVYKRHVEEKISMKKLFNILKIESKENSEYSPKFNIMVEGPSGFNKISKLFRTEKQLSNTLYFSNGKTLECAQTHMLRCNGEWKYAKNIIPKKDVIETKNGITFLTKRFIKKNYKILYDISVCNVHSYYSNGVLSHNSWILSSLGLNALKNGKNVLHFTLELNENYTGMRYDSRLIGIPSQKLKYNIDELKIKILSDIKGKLRIKYYPTKSVGVMALKSHLNKLIGFGFMPDLVIVDYADILKSDNVNAIKGGSYFEAGGIYEDLRGLAGEFQVPVATASQAQRCIFIDEYVNEKSKGKIKIAEVEIGNLIETANGFAKVDCVFEEESQPCYKIKTKRGNEITVSAKHLFPTENGLKSIETGLKIKDKIFIKK